jgi:uncharacterized protein YndB with AHSA1/START domain
MEPLRIAFEVACDATSAFSIWTERTSAWWPTVHTVSRERAVEIVFEPRIGGRVYERTSTGLEHDWGRVTAWDPPHRLAYLWHIATDPTNATDVEVRFIELGGQATRVEVDHDGWDRLGPRRGHAWRGVNQAGWDGVLPQYIGACATAATKTAGRRHT